MAHRCPPWFCAAFDNPVRRLVHDPVKMLRPYVRERMTVLDVGAGKGYFAIPMARLVGPAGRVVAADIHPAMLKGIMRRAGKAGLTSRITPRLVAEDASDYGISADFVLMFWVLHEVPDQDRILAAVRRSLKKGGRLFIAEPRLHVKKPAFEASVARCAAAGFAVEARPAVALSLAVVLS